MTSTDPATARQANQRGRMRAVRALVVAASVVLVLALVAGYARRAAVDSDQFANRATAALRDESVRTLVAERITGQVILRNQADLIAARPIIQSVASAIVGGRAFTTLFRAAVRDVHRALFRRDKDTVALTVADVGTVLAAALEKLRPSLARQVDATGRVRVIRRDVGSLSATLARIDHTIRLLAVFLLLLCLLLAGGALALSLDRRRTVVELGIGVACAGVFLVVAYAVLRSLAVNHVDGPEEQAAAGAVWDVFLGDLRTAAWILAGSGAVVAAAAASLIRPVDLREPLRRAARYVTTEPSRPALRALRGIGFVAAGLVVLIARDAVLQLLLTACGVFLIYAGVTALLRLVYQPPVPSDEAPRPRARRPPALRGRRLATPLIAVAIIAGAVAAFLGTGGTTTAAPAKGPCNGHQALCDRPLDQVVLPATHNAMSVPLPGWFAAEQERPIADQLADGIRGLLIDTHYADRLPDGKLRTDFGGREELRRQLEHDAVSPHAVDAALRIRARLGFSGGGKRGMISATRSASSAARRSGPCWTICATSSCPIPTRSWSSSTRTT